MGIMAVMILILLFIFLPFLFPFFIRPKPVDNSAFKKEIAALKLKEPDSAAGFKKENDEGNHYPPYYQPPEGNYYNKQVKGELFYFDPNTLPEEGWKKLGIREKTISTIRNYISKGGKFYKPEDIGKIWGLHEEEISRLMPYVRIAEMAAADPAGSKNNGFNKTYDKPKYTAAAVDVNLADSTAFISLPGIGSKLANRIISFREKLGGFYRIEQVAETFGLPDSTFQKIRDKLQLADPTVKKININTATVEELKIHPYIRYHIANAIVQYRNQHGNFTAGSDLKNIMIITDDVFTKMEPYLSLR